MITSAQTVPAPESILSDAIPDALPEIRVPAWAWMVVLAAAFTIYLVTMENGALLGSAASTLHEFFHDGRHIAAVPCH